MSLRLLLGFEDLGRGGGGGEGDGGELVRSMTSIIIIAQKGEIVVAERSLLSKFTWDGVEGAWVSIYITFCDAFLRYLLIYP